MLVIVDRDEHHAIVSKQVTCDLQPRPHECKPSAVCFGSVQVTKALHRFLIQSQLFDQLRFVFLEVVVVDEIVFPGIVRWIYVYYLN